MLGVQGHLASNSFPTIMKFLVFKNTLQLLMKVWREGHLHTHTEGNLAILYELLEKAMAPHSSTLAWKIPWAEEPGGLQSMGSRRVGHDWVTPLSLFTFMHWRGNGNPFQLPGESSCLENPRDGGAWWAAVYGVAWSQTQLKWLSSIRTLFFFFR